MWLTLTKSDGAKTAIDFGKVLHLSDHKSGTQIVVNSSVPSKENGAPTPLVLYVAESFDAVVAALGAKKVKR
jgi:hypothetical protein